MSDERTDYRCGFCGDVVRLLPSEESEPLLPHGILGEPEYIGSGTLPVRGVG